MASAEEHRRGAKRKISLTCCDTCECEAAKYRCPSCLKFSCSLPCVKRHKLASGCSGVRDRTAFVPLAQFDEIDLLSDYRFLEEATRVADTPNRDVLLRTPQRQSCQVKWMKRKARAARVNLKILPKPFSRRRENTSFFNIAEAACSFRLQKGRRDPGRTNVALLKGVLMCDTIKKAVEHLNSPTNVYGGELGVFASVTSPSSVVSAYLTVPASASTCTSTHPHREQKLYWHLKLHFPQSSAEFTDRVPEDRLLEKIISDYIHPTESDPVKRQRLKVYVLSPPDDICVFMRCEQRTPNAPKFQQLDVKKSVRENLMFKAVLEYPEFHVVLKGHTQQYHTHMPGGRSSHVDHAPTTTPTNQAAPASERAEHRTRGQKEKDEELEEGEICSEEEAEEDEEGHVEENVTLTTGAPSPCEHEEEGECDGEDDVKTVAPPPGGDEEEEEKDDKRADDIITVAPPPDGNGDDQCIRGADDIITVAPPPDGNGDDQCIRGADDIITVAPPPDGNGDDQCIRGADDIITVAPPPDGNDDDQCIRGADDVITVAPPPDGNDDDQCIRGADDIITVAPPPDGNGDDQCIRGADDIITVAPPPDGNGDDQCIRGADDVITVAPPLASNYDDQL